MGRYISSNVAVWRIFNFPDHERHSTAIHLSVYLENGQNLLHDKIDCGDLVLRNSLLPIFYTKLFHFISIQHIPILAQEFSPSNICHSNKSFPTSPIYDCKGHLHINDASSENAQLDAMYQYDSLHQVRIVSPERNGTMPKPLPSGINRVRELIRST
ncbi:hypothetical protein AVEN_113643-1 [Araneus ventricosus]|uniref:Uncharacterized protein n=1 Tax=Araneus ventricosus TaxID=182803 RepID=A0A4Y2IRI9_ARAVE|nr:hypothetical protein AVEN_113643-1 [Araneus ventricosus]